MNMDLRATGQASEERAWYALYTRPRFEKKVDSLLKQKDVQSFLPQRFVIRQWSNNRKRKIAEPLFSSYVFVFANLRERHLATRTYGVATLVTFNGQPARIPEDEIQGIHRVLQHGYDPEPHQAFKRGDEVEMASGPLQGIRGVLFEERGQTKLLISVSLINQCVAVSVDRGQVRKLRGSKVPSPKMTVPPLTSQQN